MLAGQEITEVISERSTLSTVSTQERGIATLESKLSINQEDCLSGRRQEEGRSKTTEEDATWSQQKSEKGYSSSNHFEQG